MDRIRRAALLVVLLLAGRAGRAGAQPRVPEVVVVGSVFDTTGATIADVEVALVGGGTSPTVRSDANGEFRFPGMRPAEYRLRARRIGYAPRVITIDGSAGDTLSITLNLVPAAPVLERVVVEEPLSPLARGKLAGFSERRRTLAVPPSSFVTRDEIERRSPRRVSDLVKLRGPRATACLSGPVYLDGVLTISPGDLQATQARLPSGRRPPRPRPEDAVDLVSPDEVEAIEIYRGKAESPVGYDRHKSGCAILIWTR